VLDEVEQRAAAFLERDFTESFAQLRHYDSQLWDVWKFSLTAYSALLGTAVGLYKYSIEKDVDLVPAAIAVLVVGLLLGIVFLALAIRTRTYYVITARYINHPRYFFLKKPPLDLRMNLECIRMHALHHPSTGEACRSGYSTRLPS